MNHQNQQWKPNVTVAAVIERDGNFLLVDRLPAGIGLGVYRIVQESLTNTLKHAGVGARATVRVRRLPSQVEVDILDGGGGRISGQKLAGGNGLIGMRERTNVYGGSLTAGPRPEGGWSVRAIFPTDGE